LREFVDRVGEDILRGKVLEEDAMDLCSTVDVQLHTGRSNNIFDITRDVTDPTAVLDPQRFHTG
jgi:hypothetical protein